MARLVEVLPVEYVEYVGIAARNSLLAAGDVADAVRFSVQEHDEVLVLPELCLTRHGSGVGEL